MTIMTFTRNAFCAHYRSALSRPGKYNLFERPFFWPSMAKPRPDVGTVKLFFFNHSFSGVGSTKSVLFVGEGPGIVLEARRLYRKTVSSGNCVTNVFLDYRKIGRNKQLWIRIRRKLKIKNPVKRKVLKIISHHFTLYGLSRLCLNWSSVAI